MQILQEIKYFFRLHLILDSIRYDLFNNRLKEVSVIEEFANPTSIPFF
jgi:hypothetical protein